MNEQFHRESLVNSQQASRTDLLAAFDDEQLFAWGASLNGSGEPFAFGQADVQQWIERLLAACSLAQEINRRREVAALEDDAAGA